MLWREAGRLVIPLHAASLHVHACVSVLLLPLLLLLTRKKRRCSVRLNATPTVTEATTTTTTTTTTVTFQTSTIFLSTTEYCCYCHLVLCFGHCRITFTLTSLDLHLQQPGRTSKAARPPPEFRQRSKAKVTTVGCKPSLAISSDLVFYFPCCHMQDHTNS